MLLTTASNLDCWLWSILVWCTRVYCICSCSEAHVLSDPVDFAFVLWIRFTGLIWVIWGNPDQNLKKLARLDTRAIILNLPYRIRHCFSEDEKCHVLSQDPHANKELRWATGCWEISQWHTMSLISITKQATCISLQGVQSRSWCLRVPDHSASFQLNCKLELTHMRLLLILIKQGLILLGWDMHDTGSCMRINAAPS